MKDVSQSKSKLIISRIQFFQIIFVLIWKLFLFRSHFSEEMPFVNIVQHIGNVNDFNLKSYLFNSEVQMGISIQP